MQIYDRVLWGCLDSSMEPQTAESSLAVKGRGTNASVTRVASIRLRHGGADAANPAHRVHALLIGIKHALPRPGVRITEHHDPCGVRYSIPTIGSILFVVPRCDIHLSYSCIAKHSCVSNFTQGREKICVDYVPGQLPMVRPSRSCRPDGEAGNSQFGKWCPIYNSPHAPCRQLCFAHGTATIEFDLSRSKQP